SVGLNTAAKPQIALRVLLGSAPPTLPGRVPDRVVPARNSLPSWKATPAVLVLSCTSSPLYELAPFSAERSADRAATNELPLLCVVSAAVGGKGKLFCESLLPPTKTVPSPKARLSMRS